MRLRQRQYRNIQFHLDVLCINSDGYKSWSSCSDVNKHSASSYCLQLPGRRVELILRPLVFRAMGKSGRANLQGLAWVWKRHHVCKGHTLKLSHEHVTVSQHRPSISPWLVQVLKYILHDLPLIHSTLYIEHFINHLAK